MKNTLVAFTLIATSGLLAQEDYAPNIPKLHIEAAPQQEMEFLAEESQETALEENVEEEPHYFSEEHSVVLSPVQESPSEQSTYSDSCDCEEGCGSFCTSCDPCDCSSCSPKDCIKCTCFTPPFYDLECDWGFFFSVDFLYWYGRETNLAFSHEALVKSKSTAFSEFENEVFAPQAYTYLGAAWDPGVRVALGWNSSCDGWDWRLEWTYYRNKKSDSTSVPPDFSKPTPPASFGDPSLGQSVLINPWINPSFGITHTPTFFADIKATWKLKFNNLDFTLGRKYWLSNCFALRPYAGLRAGWTKINFDTNSQRNASFPNLEILLTFKDDFTTKYWGVGMVGGFEPTWYFCQNFALFGNIDAALLWGKFSSNKSENYREERPISTIKLATNYRNSYKSDFFMMKPILDLAIGLRWEETWCCNRYRTALDIGWENHIWFDHNHRHQPMVLLDTFSSSRDESLAPPRLLGYRTFQEAQGNLMMGGLVVRARFDF